MALDNSLDCGQTDTGAFECSCEWRRWKTPNNLSLLHVKTNSVVFNKYDHLAQRVVQRIDFYLSLRTGSSDFTAFETRLLNTTGAGKGRRSKWASPYSPDDLRPCMSGAISLIASSRAGPDGWLSLRLSAADPREGQRSSTKLPIRVAESRIILM